MIDFDDEKDKETYMKLYGRSERLSYEFQKLVVDRVHSDPDFVFEIAAKNIPRIRPHGQGRLFDQWMDEWERIVTERDVKTLEEVCLGSSQYCVDMRQVAPFAGTITQDQRLEIIERERKRRVHYRFTK